MQPATKPQAILFDLDGTLIDRQASIASYARLVATDFADELLEQDQAKIERLLSKADGHGYRSQQRHLDIARTLLPVSGAQEADRHWRSNFPGLAVLAKGAIEVLSKLMEADIALGLVTNGSITAQTKKLQSLQLTPYFKTISISEAVGIKKPDPRIFEVTLTKLNCQPKDAWFVGDHPVNDVWGAEQIGMRGFLLPGVSWPEGYNVCGTSIENLASLLSFLD